MTRNESTWNHPKPASDCDMKGQSMTCFQHRIHLNCTPGSAGAYLGTVQIWIWKSPQLKNTLAVLEQNQERRNTTATCLFLQHWHQKQQESRGCCEILITFHDCICGTSCTENYLVGTKVKVIENIFSEEVFSCTPQTDPKLRKHGCNMSPFSCGKMLSSCNASMMKNSALGR